jgi:hypothetical protein
MLNCQMFLDEDITKLKDWLAACPCLVAITSVVLETWASITSFGVVAEFLEVAIIVVVPEAFVDI